MAGSAPLRVLERYAMYEPFARGGMATVHFGRLLGAVGFSRPVAIKKLYAHFTSDPDFVAMFLDEARLAARIQHPNVVQTLDAVSSQGELFVVLEYIHGQSLAELLRTARARATPVPVPIVASIVFGALEGLHAAHEARDAQGEPLEIVHRDVSPQNVLVGVDGVARVLDFGIAKAKGRAHVTRDGEVKGKLAYMAPEQIRGDASRRSDVFAATVVLWEALTGRRLFEADDVGALALKVLHEEIDSPRRFVPEVSVGLEAVVRRGLERDPEARYGSAREMALALQASVPLASAIDVGAWVQRLASEALEERAARLATIEHAPPAPLTESHAGSLAQLAGPEEFTTLASDEQSASLPTAHVPGLAAVGPSPRAATAPAHRRVRVTAAGFAALASIAALVVLTFVASRSARRDEPQHAASAPSLADSRGAPGPLAATAPVSDPGSASAASAASMIGGVASAPTATSSPHAKSPAQSPAKSPNVAHAPRPPVHDAKKESCAPPYTVDALGMRHYKPACI